MARAAGHPVDLGVLEIVDERGLAIDDRRAVALLAVIVVAPGVDLTAVGHGETVKRAHGHVNDLLAAQALDEAGPAHVVVVAVAEAEVVALAPGPDLAVLGQGQGELGAALDLHDAEAVEALDVGGHVAAVAAASAELACGEQGT